MVPDGKKLLIEMNPIVLYSLFHPGKHITHVGTYASAKPQQTNKKTLHYEYFSICAK